MDLDPVVTQAELIAAHAAAIAAEAELLLAQMHSLARQLSTPPAPMTATAAPIVCPHPREGLVRISALDRGDELRCTACGADVRA